MSGSGWLLFPLEHKSKAASHPQQHFKRMFIFGGLHVMLFVEGEGRLWCSSYWGQNSLHKLAANPEQSQTLTWQEIALAVGNVTLLDGRSTSVTFVSVSAVVLFCFFPNSQDLLLNALMGKTFGCDLTSWEAMKEGSPVCRWSVLQDVLHALCPLSCLSTVGLMQWAVWGLELSWKQLKGWGQIICFYKRTVPMPTERAHGAVIASKGVVSVEEISTTGNGWFCCKFPCQDLRHSEAAPNHLCFIGLKSFWQQRITGAGGYLGQMPATTGCGAGGKALLGIWGNKLLVCQLTGTAEICRTEVSQGHVTWAVRSDTALVKQALELFEPVFGSGAHLRKEFPSGIWGCEWRTHSSATSSLQAQPGATCFQFLPSTEAILCLLLLLFVYSSPHPICLSPLLPPVLFPSLSLLPLIPCKRLIILTGSAMAFISLRQPRNVCEHLLWHPSCSLTNQISHFPWSDTVRNVGRGAGGKLQQSQLGKGHWGSIQLGCHVGPH